MRDKIVMKSQKMCSSVAVDGSLVVVVPPVQL